MVFQKPDAEFSSIGWLAMFDISQITIILLVAACSYTMNDVSSLHEVLRNKEKSILDIGTRLDEELRRTAEWQKRHLLLEAAWKTQSREMVGLNEELGAKNLGISRLDEELKVKARESVLLREELKTRNWEISRMEEESKAQSRESDFLNEELGAKNRKVQSLNRDLEGVRQELLDAGQNLERTVSEFQERLDERDLQMTRLQESFAGLESKHRETERSNQKLKAQNREIHLLKKGLENKETRERGIRQELLGVKGSLDRAVFVFDRSGSMDSTTPTGVSRWKAARNIMEAWLLHLPVRECGVVAYNERTAVFSNRFLPTTGEEGEKNRETISAWIRNLNPGGNTNTQAALNKAFEFYPTSIFLFTDGQPNVSETPGCETFEDHARTILDLCTGQQIPINVVALGNYYADAKFADFLLQLAEVTNGSFQGR